MSEEKFSKCREGKNVSVEFRVFGKKKMKLKEKFREKKWVEILLSSCSLVGLCKLKLKFEIEVKITVGNKKMIAGVWLEPNHVWAPCCE